MRSLQRVLFIFEKAFQTGQRSFGEPQRNAEIKQDKINSTEFEDLNLLKEKFIKTNTHKQKAMKSINKKRNGKRK